VNRRRRPNGKRIGMTRRANNTRLPDASEERIIECPVCSNVMTTMTAEGVTVDLCAGGAGSWFDAGELAIIAHRT
jgi:hypothetical protein